MKLFPVHVVLLTALLITGCSDWFMDDPEYQIPVVYHDVVQDNEVITANSHEEYEKLCIRTEYYFCPGVSGPLMRIAITKDVCVDPPTVLSMSECEEYLECDPHHYQLDDHPCVTDTGIPGVYSEYCIKGFIKQGPCEGAYKQDMHEDIFTYEDTAVDTTTLEFEDSYDEVPTDATTTCMKEDVDILVVLDLSASMIQEMQSVYDLAKSFSMKHKDATHVQWALVAGPKNAGNKPGNHNFLHLASNLQQIDGFQLALEETLNYDLIGQYEMLYDALYLSLRNISSFLPYQWEELLWPVWVGNVIDESVPPLEDFYIDWRKDSRRVIIVFTDEPGQSFLIPASKVGKSYNTNDTITLGKLVSMLESTDDVTLYTFTDVSSKGVNDAWWPLATITGGKTFELGLGMENTLDQLEDILYNEVCF